METHRIYIKSMVCNRCIEAVEEVVSGLGIEPRQVLLGEVELRKPLTPVQRDTLSSQLAERGFELLEDRNSQLIEQIKSRVIEYIHHKEEKVKFSSLLSEELGKDYNSLSTLFSSVEGITLERYIILQRIEKVKELLIYDQLNMSEIADSLGYSSVQHLSNQFKKATGMTPSEFKGLRNSSRSPLDSI